VADSIGFGVLTGADESMVAKSLCAEWKRFPAPAGRELKSPLTRHPSLSLSNVLINSRVLRRWPTRCYRLRNSFPPGQSPKRETQIGPQLGRRVKSRARQMLCSARSLLACHDVTRLIESRSATRGQIDRRSAARHFAPTIARAQMFSSISAPHQRQRISR
jgi:hypothetical protein